jgi:phosphotransferase system enzyme I (PtsI)
MYKGIAGSEGIGIGNVVIIEEHEIVIENKKITDTDAEIARLQGAIEKFVNDTNAMADRMEKTVGAKDADILRGHIQMLQDPTIEEQITALIVSEKITAEKALDQVLEQTAEIFAQIPDELLQQRATDFRDIKARILKILLGIEDYDISAAPAGTVLVAHDLTPSMTAGIVAENIAGILTEVGGRTSHSAILARAMEIPAVLSIDGICTAVKNGDRVVLNGTSGEAIVNPDAETEQKFAGLLEEYKKEKELLKKFAGVPTVSADGTKVELVCNIGKPEDAKKAVECDGEGIGLFRTEFLFMDRDTIPTEEEQFEAYKSVAETMKGKPVIIRTLDIGGDKEIPYLGLEKEDNPFLGYRAIRFCLQRTDIYNTQLRALVRASAFGRIKIMVPLVTGVDELRSVKAMVADIMKELDAEGIAYNKNLEIGIMMETPAACMMADVLAKEAAFMLSEEFIIFEKKAKNRKDVLKRACQLLINKGIVQSEFARDVLEREKVEATAVGCNIAIPHGKPEHVNRCQILVIRLDKPIEWGERMADMIFLLAINFDSVNTTKAFFHDFTKLLNENGATDRLREAASPHELCAAIRKELGWN